MTLNFVENKYVLLPRFGTEFMLILVKQICSKFRILKMLSIKKLLQFFLPHRLLFWK